MATTALLPGANVEAGTVSVATHGARRRMQSSLGLIVPSTTPLVESVNFTFPSGPTRKPGRTLAVSVTDAEESTAVGDATSVVVVATRKSAMLGAAIAPSPATAITVVPAMKTSRRRARLKCPGIFAPLSISATAEIAFCHPPRD